MKITFTIFLALFSIGISTQAEGSSTQGGLTTQAEGSSTQGGLTTQAAGSTQAEGPAHECDDLFITSTKSIVAKLVQQKKLKSILFRTRESRAYVSQRNNITISKSNTEDPGSSVDFSKNEENKNYLLRSKDMELFLEIIDPQKQLSYFYSPESRLNWEYKDQLGTIVFEPQALEYMAQVMFEARKLGRDLTDELVALWFKNTIKKYRESEGKPSTTWFNGISTWLVFKALASISSWEMSGRAILDRRNLLSNLDISTIALDLIPRLDALKVQTDVSSAIIGFDKIDILYFDFFEQFIALNENPNSNPVHYSSRRVDPKVGNISSIVNQQWVEKVHEYFNLFIKPDKVSLEDYARKWAEGKETVKNSQLICALAVYHLRYKRRFIFDELSAIASSPSLLRQMKLSEDTKKILSDLHRLGYANDAEILNALKFWRKLGNKL